MRVSVVAVTAIVAITIPAVSMFTIAILTIFSVTAIAIIIAVLSLRHIYTVEYQTGIRKFVFLSQCFNQLKVRLWCLTSCSHLNYFVFQL